MEEFIKLITYFIVYSFLGWVMESILKTYLQKKFVNSGFLYGPFCPIYGCGAIIMFLLLNNFKSNPILIFFISFFVLSIWEYIVGILLEKIFHTKYWDYSENKFNFQGRVCLTNSIYWGILGVLFTFVIHPCISYVLDFIPKDIIQFSTIMLLIYLVGDTIISTIKVKNINVKASKLKQLNQTIKEKLAELKEVSQNQTDKTSNIENIQKMIEELKYKQTRLKRKLLKQTNRLRKAFPTMKSDTIEKISDFLNQKMEEMRRERKK